MSHTPGPWVFDPELGAASVLTIRSEERVRHWHHVVARVRAEGKRTPPAERTKASERRFAQRLADARLIAAAPDLLTALQAVIRDEGKELSRSVLNMAYAAVAKATGEPTC